MLPTPALHSKSRRERRPSIRLPQRHPVRDSKPLMKTSARSLWNTIEGVRGGFGNGRLRAYAMRCCLALRQRSQPKSQVAMQSARSLWTMIEGVRGGLDNGRLRACVMRCCLALRQQSAVPKSQVVMLDMLGGTVGGKNSASELSC